MYWDFGDGHDTITTNQTYVSHKYLNSGFYNVKLTTINDISHCRDSLIKTDPTFGGYIKVAKLIPDFKQDKSSICEYNNINFKNTSLTNTKISKWEWIFGDGNNSTGINDSITHQYNKYGVDTTILKVTDLLGCVDSIIKPHNDTVHKLPSPRFLVDKTDGCKPL